MLDQRSRETSPLMTVKEVAEFLAVTERTVYRLMKECNLPACWVGGGWRFRAKTVDAWTRGETNAG